VASNPRIEDLRRRLEKEPGSRLFAQLAEELRKVGDLDEAMSLCSDGLQKHPNYPSARMTFGRCLFDKGDLAGARREFEAVVKAAPDNILAGRFLAESLEGLGETKGAADQYRAVLRLAPGDGQVAQRLAAVEARLVAPAAPASPGHEAPPAPEEVAGAGEPAPIPLASVEGEAFELERPYEAGRAAREAESTAGPGVPQVRPVEELAAELPEAAAAPAPEPTDPSPGEPSPLPVQEPAPADPSAREAFWGAEPERLLPAVARGGPGLRRLEGEPPPPWVDPAAPRPPEPVPASPEIASSTLAELYFSQGVTGKAIEVYRQVLLREPENERARLRLAELERSEPAPPLEAATAPSATRDSGVGRRAVIQRTIGQLEAMLTAVRKD
jgi:tetratricopeptide (TPR) repeat protein